MEVEECFGVSISDEEAVQVINVGDLFALVVEKTADQSHKSDVCLTASTFYDLRQKLVELGLDARKVRPAAELQMYFQTGTRRSGFRKLAERMDLVFPRLERPTWLVQLSWTLTAIIILGCVWEFGGSVGFAAGLVSALVLFFLTLPAAVQFSSDCTTFRGLVTKLVALNFKKLSERYSARTAQDVWVAVQDIVAVQLGVEKRLVVPTAHFVKDLGLS